MKSKIHLQKLENYSLDNVEQFVRSSLEVLDPKASLFSSGQKVLLKPNLLRGFKPERCVTTHPVVVEAMCRVLKDLSVSKIVISDSPALGSLTAVANQAGYGLLEKKYGAQILPLTDPISFENAEGIPHLKIAGCLNQFDRIVNLPKVKSHCQMTLTLSIKNLFGLVIGKRKPVLHCLVKNDKIKFGKMLIDIARHVNPCLTIMDGIQAMQGQGPSNGTPYPLGVIGAGTDMTALDRIFADILNIPLDQVYALQAARLKNFGQYHTEHIEVSGPADYRLFAVEDFKQACPLDISFNPFRLIKSFIKQFYEIGIKEPGHARWPLSRGGK
ncbi:MAG: DUF362 domain-containing protein [Nitrospina sp.]|jgi:uncharacterized protein (DUF362 family)|nr:DUF362 domain-containing protein [Nitrospina sp.]MBT5632696.1 DUF362 domain-containing protein [Nitrospina sp.]